MFTIAITNRKGGSGKTTTAVNLSSQLSIDYPDKRFLIIDLDSQNQVKLGLDKDNNKTVLSIHKIFSHSRYTYAGMVQKTQWPNLFYIPADEEAMENNSASFFQRLKMFLNNSYIKTNFDMVILDTPPSHGNFLINALVAADAVIITFIPQKLDKSGLDQMLKLLKRHTPQQKRYAFLPTMTKSRLLHHNDTLANLVKSEGNSRLLKGIRSRIQLAEAFAAGKPIQHFSPNSQAAFDYHMLANELRIIWPEAFKDLGKQAQIQCKVEKKSLKQKNKRPIPNNLIHMKPQEKNQNKMQSGIRLNKDIKEKNSNDPKKGSA